MGENQLEGKVYMEDGERIARYFLAREKKYGRERKMHARSTNSPGKRKLRMRRERLTRY